MRKVIWLAAVAAAAVAGIPARASAQKDAGPALEVRVRAVNDLVAKFEYVGEIVNQPEQAKQVAGVVRGLADEKKGIEGVDPARPIGAYGSLTSDVVDSPAVVMIPLADEQAFLDLLTGKLNVEPKKGDDGAYEVKVPNVPVPVFFRFANKYVYVTGQTRKSIDPAKLIDPKTFFAEKDDALASIHVHLDRLPDDVKKTAFGQFELKLAEAKEQKEPGETPAQRKLRLWALDQVASAAQAVLADGKELAVRFVADPKTDDLTTEFTFSAKDGSGLAKAFRGLAEETGTAAALGAEKNALLAGGVRFTLPESSRKELAPIIDDLAKEAVDKAKDSERQAAKMALAAVTPTLRAGVLDAGIAVTGSSEKPVLVAALRVAEGKGVEKTIRQFAPFVPEDKAKFEFDVKKAGGLTLHKVTVHNADLKKSFGTDTVWLGTGDDLLMLSIEPDGKALAAAAERLAGKGHTVRPLSLEFSVAGLEGVAEHQLKPERVKELTAEAFPNGPAGKDTFLVRVEGGDALKVRVTLKGKALKLGVLVDQEKKK